MFESLWKLNDYVSVQFPGNGTIQHGKVIKVSFTNSYEPLYDVEVPCTMDGVTVHARLHGIKEWYLRNRMAENWDAPEVFGEESAKEAIRRFPMDTNNPPHRYTSSRNADLLDHRNAFIQGALYARGLLNGVQRKSMRWVKLSERLPGDALEAAARYTSPDGNHHYSFLTLEGDMLFVGEEKTWEKKDIPSDILASWEWLDESK